MYFRISHLILLQCYFWLLYLIILPQLGWESYKYHNTESGFNISLNFAVSFDCNLTAQELWVHFLCLVVSHFLAAELRWSQTQSSAAEGQFVNKGNQNGKQEHDNRVNRSSIHKSQGNIVVNTLSEKITNPENKSSEQERKSSNGLCLFVSLFV